MALTLRLSDEQTEALRRKAEAEHRSMQQVARAAIHAYVHQPTPQRRRSVPVAELATLFGDLPAMSADEFRAEQDGYADTEAHFDAYTPVFAKAGTPSRGHLQSASLRRRSARQYGIIAAEVLSMGRLASSPRPAALS